MPKRDSFVLISMSQACQQQSARSMDAFLREFLAAKAWILGES
jgi:hypothetical protein